MANLIITVISIALVAVAALMGAYYGGTAFMDGQSKAQANQLISASEQIANAYRMYVLDNNGSRSMTDPFIYDGSSADLIPKYLTAIPTINFNVSISGDTPSSVELFHHPQLTLIGNDALSGPNGSEGANGLIFYRIPQKTCERIYQMAEGTTASLPNTDWAGWGSTATLISKAKPFYCAYMAGQSSYTFVYRFF